MSRNFLVYGLILFLGLTACTKSDQSNKPTADSKVVVIGEFGSMTGGEATFGISTHQGIMLAVKEQNAAGGIQGKTIKIETVDDQGKPEDAATSVTKLITQDHVPAIL